MKAFKLHLLEDKSELLTEVLNFKQTGEIAYDLV
jgi:hypothetical protein